MQAALGVWWAWGDQQAPPRCQLGLDAPGVHACHPPPQVPAKGQGSGGAQLDPIEQLRASLLAAQPRKSMSRAARAMLAPPEVLELPHVPAHTSACLRAAHWLPGLLGVSPKVFVMALQMVTAYTVVLAMMVVPAVDNAFNQSLNWCLFVVVSVIEQSTGAPPPSPAPARQPGLPCRDLRDTATTARLLPCSPCAGWLAGSPGCLPRGSTWEGSQLPPLTPLHLPSPPQGLPSSRACSGWPARCCLPA